MRAVHFLGNRKLEVVDIPDPTPDAGEVILEIRASGCAAPTFGSIAPPIRRPSSEA